MSERRSSNLFSASHFRFSCLLIALTLTLILGLHTFFCLLIAPDGAFNLQAAVNLFAGEGLTLDYRPNQHLQTLSPFQFFNGLFIQLIGKSLYATQAASIFFLLLLLTFICVLAVRYNTSLIFLSFVTLIYSPAFMSYGFSGLGEVPGLFYGLLAAYLICFHANSSWAVILAGTLLALCLTTKWVLHLLIPAFVLLLIVRPLGSKRLLLFVCPLASLYTALTYYHLSFLPDGAPGIMYRAIADQSVPRSGLYGWELVSGLSGHLERLQRIWIDYSVFSLGCFALLKVFLGAVFLYLLLKKVLQRNFDEKNTFLIFLGTAFLTYALWITFINSQWVGRRSLNMDVLLFLGVGLIPSLTRSARRLHLVFLSCLLPLLLVQLSWFQHRTEACRDCSLEDYEQGLRAAIHMLPANRKLFGYHILEAPITRFLIQEEVQDLFRTPILFDCVERECNNYLIQEPGRDTGDRAFALVREVFDLEKIWSLRKFSIYRIKGYQVRNLKHVRSIDFSDKEAVEASVQSLHLPPVPIYGGPTIRAWEKAFALRSLPGESKIVLELEQNDCLADRKATAIIWNKNGGYSLSDLSPGDGKVSISLRDEFQASPFYLAFLLSPRVRGVYRTCNQRVDQLSLQKITLQ